MTRGEEKMLGPYGRSHSIASVVRVPGDRRDPGSSSHGALGDDMTSLASIREDNQIDQPRNHARNSPAQKALPCVRTLEPHTAPT